MQKITELTETRFKTVKEKDASGNRISKQVPYRALRTVKVVSGGLRFAHFFVDLIAYYLLYYLCLFISSYIAASSDAPFQAIIVAYYISVFFMLSFPIYYICFEHFFQRTPGKFLTKSIVIDIYGNKPPFGTNILRNLLRLIPFETLSCAFNERGWHDRFSETFVVKEVEYNNIRELLAHESVNSDSFTK